MSEKEPSGAQKRKARRLALEQARRNEESRKSSAGAPPPRKLLDKPPIGDPVAGVAWVHDVLLTMLWEVLQDEQITAEQRWKYASDLGAKVGMTHSKAHVQKRLKDLSKSDEPTHDEELTDNPLYGDPPKGGRGKTE